MIMLVERFRGPGWGRWGRALLLVAEDSEEVVEESESEAWWWAKLDKEGL